MSLIEIRYEPEFVVRFSESDLLDVERFAPSTLFESGGPVSTQKLREFSATVRELD